MKKLLTTVGIIFGAVAFVSAQSEVAKPVESSTVVAVDASLVKVTTPAKPVTKETPAKVVTPAKAVTKETPARAVPVESAVTTETKTKVVTSEKVETKETQTNALTPAKSADKDQSKTSFKAEEKKTKEKN